MIPTRAGKLSTQPSKKYPGRRTRSQYGQDANPQPTPVRDNAPQGLNKETDQGQGGKDNAYLKPVKAHVLT